MVKQEMIIQASLYTVIGTAILIVFDTALSLFNELTILYPDTWAVTA